MERTSSAALLQHTSSKESLSRSWLLLLGILFIALNLRAPITAVGPIVHYIQQSMGLSGALTGLLTTLPLLAFALISPLAPIWAEKMGIERILFVSMLVLAGAIVIRSLPAQTALFAGTALLGMAIAVANVLVPSLVKRDFHTQVGLITGLYTVLMNLGGAMGSGLSIPAIEQLGISWQAMLAGTALIALIAAVVWLPQLRSQKHQSMSRTEKERDNITLWRSKVAWLVTLFLGLQSFCFYVNVTWIPEILIDRGLEPVNAGWMVSLLLFVSMPATFVFPIMAGRRSSQRRFTMITAIMFVIGYAGLLSGGTALIPLWMIIIGIASGAGFALAVMFFVLRTSSTSQSARLSGMAQSFGYLLAASGPLLFGLLHDLTNGWTFSLVMIITVSVLYGIVGWGAGANRLVKD